MFPTSKAALEYFYATMELQVHPGLAALHPKAAKPVHKLEPKDVEGHLSRFRKVEDMGSCTAYALFFGDQASETNPNELTPGGFCQWVLLSIRWRSFGSR